MESNYDFTDKTVSASNASIVASNNHATITGVIPATQEAVKVGNVYKANMNYAYMYAAKKIGASSHGNVELSFKPLVTTLEFRLKGNSALPIGVNLTKLELSSASSPLTGTFTATVTESGVDPATDITVPAFAAGTNDKITIILPTEEGATTPGIELTDTPVTFTFLTLPTDQTDLTLTLYFGADYAGKPGRMDHRRCLQESLHHPRGCSGRNLGVLPRKPQRCHSRASRRFGCLRCRIRKLQDQWICHCSRPI